MEGLALIIQLQKLDPINIQTINWKYENCKMIKTTVGLLLGRLYLDSCVNNSEVICTASIIGLVWLLALSET